MKIKIIFLFSILSLCEHKVISQQLTLNETMIYINQALPKINKLSITGDGFLEFIGLSILNNNCTYKVHISDIYIPTNENHPVITLSYNKDTWEVTLRCVNSIDNEKFIHSDDPSCIQTIFSSNDKSFVSYFDMRTKEGDKYSTEKLANALIYLKELAIENGLAERKDNDPFAPKNYNSVKKEIRSTSNSGAIKLQRQNGVYYISIIIGGIKRKFILDSGASEVSISSELEKELIKIGIIKKGSYLSSGLYRIADGSIVECKRVKIPQITIGNFMIKNIIASVGVGSSSLLLGKSVLDKFKKWTIDNSTETLNLVK
ncbi:MAG: retropepsin-like aspartic protease [Bacteroidota bacterium]